MNFNCCPSLMRRSSWSTASVMGLLGTFSQNVSGYGAGLNLPDPVTRPKLVMGEGRRVGVGAHLLCCIA
jgi:hypothetical protein